MEIYFITHAFSIFPHISATYLTALWQKFHKENMPRLSLQGFWNVLLRSELNNSYEILSGIERIILPLHYGLIDVDTGMSSHANCGVYTCQCWILFIYTYRSLTFQIVYLALIVPQFAYGYIIDNDILLLVADNVIARVPLQTHQMANRKENQYNHTVLPV